MSNKKRRNRHKNKPSKRKMLKMNRLLTETFDLEQSEEIPHMRNYYKESLHDMLARKRKEIEKKRNVIKSKVKAKTSFVPVGDKKDG